MIFLMLYLVFGKAAIVVYAGSAYLLYACLCGKKESKKSF